MKLSTRSSCCLIVEINCLSSWYISRAMPVTKTNAKPSFLFFRGRGNFIMQVSRQLFKPVMCEVHVTWPVNYVFQTSFPSHICLPSSEQFSKLKWGGWEGGRERENKKNPSFSHILVLSLQNSWQSWPWLQCIFRSNIHCNIQYNSSY